MRIDLDLLRRTPAYSFAEAAHYLGVPKATLRAWCVGQTYADRRGIRKTLRPLIRLDGAPSEGLSFLNLVESHVVAAIPRDHVIQLPTMRRALDYVVKRIENARPIATARFGTHGVDLFVAELGRLASVNRDAQARIAERVRGHVDLVEWDDGGLPIRLYPFTRRGESGHAPMPIVIGPRVAFGRPVIVGRAVPTAVLADRFKAGDRLNDLARDHDVPPEAIEEALRCQLN